VQRCGRHLLLRVDIGGVLGWGLAGACRGGKWKQKAEKKYEPDEAHQGPFVMF
jgi:hypothetical protein